VCFAVSQTQRAVHNFDNNKTDFKVIDMDRVTHPTTAQSWNLSLSGHWNSVTTNGTAQSRPHGPTPELLSASIQIVTHDTKGNIFFIPASVRAHSSQLVLTWNFDHRMISADVGAESVIDVTHQHDALGRRVTRTASGSTTVSVQVDQQTICDYVSGAAPASSTYRYLYGSYIDEPIVRVATSNNKTTWNHRNQQYSIVACTDSSGAVTERYAYMAYGLPTITNGASTVRTLSAFNSRYTHTDREWDAALEMYHYPARMYEATVERFCSRDPIGYQGNDRNIYRFVRSGPITRLDPLGNRSTTPPPGWDLLCTPKREIDLWEDSDTIGMPWQWMPPEMAAGERPGESYFGQTKIYFQLDCKCRGCCYGKTWPYPRNRNAMMYFPDIKIKVQWLIFINPKYKNIEWEFKDANTPTMEGIYGHEQLHVQHGNRFFNQRLLPTLYNSLNSIQSMDTWGNGSLGRLQCLTKCGELELFLNETLREVIVAETGHSDPTRIPLPGTHYPPEGTMPSKPNN
jgi:RHS repeat-associated protein